MKTVIIKALDSLNANIVHIMARQQQGDDTPFHERTLHYSSATLPHRSTMADEVTKMYSKVNEYVKSCLYLETVRGREGARGDIVSRCQIVCVTRAS